MPFGQINSCASHELIGVGLKSENGPHVKLSSVTDLPPADHLPAAPVQSSVNPSETELVQALRQAEAVGDEAGLSALKGQQKLRDLLRAKRYDAALLALNEWHKERAEDTALLDEGEALPEPKLRPATQALAALNDPALPAHLEALAGVRRWHDLGEVRRSLAGALAHPLTRAEAYNLLGVLAAESGQPEAAAEAFAAALMADPGHYRALTNRAGLAAERGDDGAAEADLRRVLELAPDHAAAYQNLAVLLRRQGKREEAVKALKKAQRLLARQSSALSDDQARRELARLPRIPRTVWLVLGLLLFFAWIWLSGGR